MVEDPRWPNLFVVGAPKCGTTSIMSQLGEHPEVFVPEVKEPRYLDTDLTYTHRTETQEAYLSLFEGGQGAQRRAEGTVFYLYSPAACRTIREETRDPRVVIMLRDPVEMVHSLHSQMVYTGNEQITSFEQAWRAAPARRRGERLAPRTNPLEGLDYPWVGRYHEHVARYLDAFGDQALVLLLDDLKADPAGTYRRICEHAGIDPGYEPDLSAKNKNTQMRFAALRDVVREPPRFVTSALSIFPASWRDAARRAILQANTREVPRDPLEPGLREELSTTFRDDVQALAELIDRDLSHWCAPRNRTEEKPEA
ncbi:MAG: sulfotransferase [Candidatus Thermoplasmatota archaeon]|nr:sulfotransferase [Candidatus Thermoplasmatota archaeon]